LASWTVQAAGPAIRDFLPPSAVVSVDARVLVFTFVVALAATLAAGVLPACQVTGRLAAGVNAWSRGSSAGRGRLRPVLVAAQVGMSVVLLCGALLLFATLRNLLGLDPGVRIAGVTTASIDLPARAYPTAERAGQLQAALIEQLQGAPGIERAGLATVLPLRWIRNGETITVPGVDEPIRVRFKRVDAGYFDTLDIALLAGRGITAADRFGGPPVVVVNQALASRLDAVAHLAAPVGRTVRIDYVNYDREIETDAEIVGVIRSERVADPGVPDPPVVYVSLAQVPSAQIKLLVRATGGVSAAVSGMRQALRAVDPTLPLGDVTTMAEVHSRTVRSASRPASALGVFAAVALLLAALGLYGILAQRVTEQRREIGIRLALGAAPGRLVRQTVRSALGLTAIGSVAGLAAAAALAPAIRRLLFGVSALDPLVLAAALSGMGVVGLAAALLPAWRAARVDPVVVLRGDA
jgi:predicted permease